eukprot:4889836-Alexandrium_andersonii.AAC.1
MVSGNKGLSHIVCEGEPGQVSAFAQIRRQHNHPAVPVLFAPIVDDARKRIHEEITNNAVALKHSSGLRYTPPSQVDM